MACFVRRAYQKNTIFLKTFLFNIICVGLWAMGYGLWAMGALFASCGGQSPTVPASSSSPIAVSFMSGVGQSASVLSTQSASFSLVCNGVSQALTSSPTNTIYVLTASVGQNCTVSLTSFTLSTTKEIFTSAVPTSIGAATVIGVYTGSNGTLATITPSIATGGLQPVQLGTSLLMSYQATGFQLNSIALTALSSSTSIGLTNQYTATGTYADGTQLNITSIVNWSSSSVSVASIGAGASGGLVTGVTAGTSTIQASYNGVTSNTMTQTITQPYLYVSNGYANSALYCQANAVTGAISNCNNANATNLTNAQGMVLNPAKTIMYFANQGTTNVTYCTINSSTKAFSSCNTTGSGFSAPQSIVLNAAGTIAYVTNGTGTSVSYCTINPATGAFSSCNGTGVVIGNNSGIGINPAGTMVYAGGGAKFYYCTINQSTGAFSSCNNTGNLFTGVFGIGFNAAGTIAYVSDAGGNKVFYCAVNQSTGALSGCVQPSNGSFSNPAMSIIMNSTGTVAFVSNTIVSGIISSCAVNQTTGDFSSCANTPVWFNGPTGLVYVP